MNRTLSLQGLDQVSVASGVTNLFYMNTRSSLLHYKIDV